MQLRSRKLTLKEEETEQAAASEVELCEEVENLQLEPSSRGRTRKRRTPQDAEEYVVSEEEEEEDVEEEELEEPVKPKGKKGKQKKNREFLQVDESFKIDKESYENLHPHQQEGIEWLYEKHKTAPGCILGDDMGLGKTVQIASFLDSLFVSDLIEKVLLVVPASLFPNWEKELSLWTSGIYFDTYYGSSSKRKEILSTLDSERKGIVITTYGMVLANYQELQDVVWDYVILDEGHQIKNPNSKTTMAIRLLECKHKIVLTGTPIQNNLMEFWCLFDYVMNGKLLGPRKFFQKNFERQIRRGYQKDATTREKNLGAALMTALQDILNPYFLRRDKKEIFSGRTRAAANLSVKKNDLVIWLKLTELQREYYNSYLESKEIRTGVLKEKQNILAAFNHIKKLCDHVLLRFQEDNFEQEFDNAMHTQTIREIIEGSTKLEFLLPLLHQLKTEGHKTLVFTQSRKMLNIIEVVIQDAGFTFARIDGTDAPQHRQEQIDEFMKGELDLFLLTTKVGGVGLTLTKADRVVIFDPSWNPASDNQAVDRVYRIGQTSDVVIYRLITCGTLEEKIYRKQVFKGSITKSTMQKDAQFRYFSEQELRDLLRVVSFDVSDTQKQLYDMHHYKRTWTQELKDHAKAIEELGIYGISDHDLLFIDNVGYVERGGQNSYRYHVESVVSRLKYEAENYEPEKPDPSKVQKASSKNKKKGKQKAKAENSDAEWEAEKENIQL